MTALVADASAVIEFLLATPKGHRVRARLAHDDAVAHIPELCPVEVASTLRGLVLAKKLAADRARQALADLVALNAERHPVDPHLQRMWELRNDLTAYDATYVTLAESLDVPLMTSDGKFDVEPVRRLIAVEVIS